MGRRGLQPTDMLTTATVLDALSFAGDIRWRLSGPDGGRHFCCHGTAQRWRLAAALSSIEPMEQIAAPRDQPGAESGGCHRHRVQALAYSAVPEPTLDQVIERGVQYLLRTQRKMDCGMLSRLR